MGVRSFMKYFLLISFLALLASCSFKSQFTRVEEDKYTITSIDTTYHHYNPNSPDNDLNGVISPSSKVIESSNRVMQYDSTVIREYPDFIRLGVFESIGIFGGDSKYGLSSGVFGTYINPSMLNSSFRGVDDGAMFTGGIYRFGIMEKRLRWFDDDKNWTYGFNLAELMFPDARLENALIGLGVFNLTKRWYFWDKIPYFALGTRFGVGAYPSAYGKLEGFAEIGSIGGLNLRAYLGYAGGWNYNGTILTNNNEFANGSTTPNFLYGGLGISLLDFVNVVPETYREWKDMENSAWNISVLEVGLLKSDADNSFFSTDSSKKLAISGVSLKLLNANLSLYPIDERLYVGTSLLNMNYLGLTEVGIAILPLRVGWWQVLLRDELILDPFIELSYYPSTYYNVGAKLTLIIPPFGNTNFSLVGGYMSGNSVGGLDAKNGLGGLKDYTDFSNFYFGLQVNIKNYIFKSSELKHNRIK